MSTEGGTQALWRADGRELFYVVPQTAKLVAVDMTPVGDQLIIGRPDRFFKFKALPVQSDGQRFLVADTAKQSPGVKVVVNWLKAVGRTAKN